MLIISASESCVFYFWKHTGLDNSKTYKTGKLYKIGQTLLNVEMGYSHKVMSVPCPSRSTLCPSPPFITRLPCLLASNWAQSTGSPDQSLEGWGRVRSRYLFSCFPLYGVPLNWLCLITTVLPKEAYTIQLFFL